MHTIRPITDHDIEPIRAIYNHYITSTSASLESAPLGVVDLRQRVDALVDSGLPWLVAEANGRTVGYAYGQQWHRRKGYRFTAEITVYVRRDQHGQGIGTALYRELFGSLHRRGFVHAVAVITLPNSSSVALHERLGMRHAGTLREIGYKFGQWVDVGYWQGTLTPGSGGAEGDDRSHGPFATAYQPCEPHYDHE